MHLHILVHRRRKKPYVYGLLRDSIRRNGKVRHRTRKRVTGLTRPPLEALCEFLQRG
ncbi:MAG TPA: hypothetical protein PKK06_06870 [Phycisphaerae bacterium]|nr:hypothetical protein [Phycisphaerae bacterium]HNU44433.1 hypothetical protein [Phycisphaerae bacterium]